MDEETRITKFAQAFAKTQHWLKMVESNPLIWQRIVGEAKKELEIARTLIPESVRELIDEAAETCTDVVSKRRRRAQ